MTIEAARIEAARIEAVRPEDVGFSSARLHRVDDAIRRLVNEEKIAGAVTLVARHGRWRTSRRLA